MAIAVRGTGWDPFTALVRQWDADFDSLVRRTFGAGAKRPATGFVPAADVVRDGDDVVVTLELPGLDVAKDVDIEVTEGRLSITGRRTEERASEQGGALVREIRTGGFRREFALPRGVTADQVSADYDRGLLNVRVRQATPAAPAPTKVKVTSLPAGRETSTEASTETSTETTAGNSAQGDIPQA